MMGKSKVLVKVCLCIFLVSSISALLCSSLTWSLVYNIFSCLLAHLLHPYLFSSMFNFLQVHPEGKYVVDIDKSIDINKITPTTRVALKNDSYVLHLVLPSKVDPLVNLMKVEKVPDSTYDMIGGLDQQIKEIKEVCHFTLTFNHSLCLIIAVPKFS